MKLTKELYPILNDKLSKYCGDYKFKLFQNGTFEIYDIPADKIDDFKIKLLQSDFVVDVNAYGKKQDDTWNLRGYVTHYDTGSLIEDIEVHDELNPKLWDKENNLLPDVKAKIEEIVNTFVEQLKERDIELKVSDIYLLGSNANYNYNEDSDLDLHIIADESFDCSKKHLSVIYDAYRSMFNNKYDINIKGINTEIYVENKDNLTNIATGVYSLKDGWIKKPERTKIPEIDQEAISKEVSKWSDRYQKIYIDPTIDEIDNYIDDLYDIRQKSIQKDGEFGLNNLVFKEIRRLGYIDELKEIKDELTSEELSLESLQENLSYLGLKLVKIDE